MPTYSRHAMERILERFADVDVDNEYATARRVGKRTKQKIKSQCPVEHARWMHGMFKGRYYMISRKKVVFVMAPVEVVITVFPLTPPESEGKQS